MIVTVTAKGGQQKVFPYTTTDVNAAFFLSPSGSSDQVFSNQDVYITDLVHGQQGTTTQTYVFFNQVNTGIVLFTAACQPGNNRQVKSSPIFVPAGTVVRFQSIT